MATQRVFLSYSRHNESAAQTLTTEIERLGQEVWIDKQLSGGQQWWNTILERIRTCDCFVFVITNASLSSKACMSELDYAHRLGRQILPVSVTDKVHDPLLPNYLAETQRIDVSDPQQVTYALAKALLNLPLSPPLPDPLPEAPPVPISYLDELAHTVGGPQLDKAQQLTLVADLKQRLSDESERDAVIALLEQLQRRPDLYAAVANDIAQSLAAVRFADPPPPPPPPPATGAVTPPPVQPVATTSAPRRRTRLLVTLSAAAVAVVLGAVGVAVANTSSGDENPPRTGSASTAAPAPTTIPTTATTPSPSPAPAPAPSPATTTDAVTKVLDGCLGGNDNFCVLVAGWCMDGDLGACQWLSESMPVDTVGEALGRCGLGALSACDDLYLNTASSSQEELFGSTCGNRYARTDGYCVQLYG